MVGDPLGPWAQIFLPLTHRSIKAVDEYRDALERLNRCKMTAAEKAKVAESFTDAVSGALTTFTTNVNQLCNRIEVESAAAKKAKKGRK